MYLNEYEWKQLWPAPNIFLLHVVEVHIEPLIKIARIRARDLLNPIQKCATENLALAEVIVIYKGKLL
jgi:hypothetical protein